MDNKMKDRIAKINENRNPPEALEEGKTVFRKENRRNKLTPRFSKHQVKQDKGLTFISHKNQKIHKSKIKKRTQ